MMSGAYAPCGTGVGATPDDVSLTLGATLLSISAIASSALRMPLPIAVPRPVVRLSTAVCSASLISCGRLDQLGKTRKRNEADLGARLLALNERYRRRLSRLQATRRNIHRAHTPGSINGKDNRSLVGGHAL